MRLQAARTELTQSQADAQAAAAALAVANAERAAAVEALAKSASEVDAAHIDAEARVAARWRVGPESSTESCGYYDAAQDMLDVVAGQPTLAMDTVDYEERSWY